MTQAFPKPKDQKKSSPKTSGITVLKDGSEITTKAGWQRRRWQLYVLVSDGGGATCFKCGCRLEFASEEGFGNYEAHHSRGTRGLGGGKRDDRMLVEGEWTKELQELFPFAPLPPDGFKWNLYALCGGCHREEHNQGCSGEPQWGLFNE
jgi:hypothetical protein